MPRKYSPLAHQLVDLLRPDEGLPDELREDVFTVLRFATRRKPDGFNDPKPMTGLLSQLTSEQRERALSWEGCVNIGPGSTGESNG